MAAPHVLHGGEELFPLDVEAVDEGQQQVLGGEVLIVELSPLAIGAVHDLLEVTRHPRFAPIGLGEGGDGVVSGVANGERGQTHPLQDRQDDALLLAQQGGQEVIRGDLRVAG